MTYSILIATGGTGGHIYPALAFADAMKANDPTIDISFVGSTSRMESTIIPDHHYPFIGLNLVVPSGSLVKKIHAALSLVNATFTMLRYFKTHHCDLVVGFGNYIETPMILAAIRFHIPIMLHEQNAIMGKANRMAMKHAAVCATSYPMDIENPGCMLIHTGNPQASNAAKLRNTAKNPKSDYGFDHENWPMVTIVMGSLGSESVNTLLKDAISLFNENPINYLIVTGKDGFASFDGVHHGSNIVIRPYVDGISAFHDSDLVVSRAGATACAELFALHKPSILIPSPYVPNDHQSKNALAAFDRGAAIMLRENGLDAASLNHTINGLIHDQNRLNQMASACTTLATANAAKAMVELAWKVIHHERIDETYQCIR